MKRMTLFLFFINAILLSCNSETHQQTTTTDSVKTTTTVTPASADSTAIDTVYHNVNIEGKMYDITFISDLYDSSHHLINEDNQAVSQLTIIIAAKEDNKVVFKKKFPQNVFELMKRPGASLSGAGKLYASLTIRTESPALVSALYSIVPDGKGSMNFVPIMDYGELSRFAINKNDSDVFRLEGDWDFNAEEGRFGEHRLRIYKYVLGNGKYTEMKLGETTNKYSAESDMKDFVEAITEQEPQALEDFKLSDYSFESN